MLEYLSVIAIPYLALTKYLRNRRTDKLTKSLGYENITAAEAYDKITLSDAQDIMLNMARFEFPRFFEVALQFALFRVVPLQLAPFYRFTC